MADRKRPEKRQKDEGDGRRRRGITGSVKPPISSKLADSGGFGGPERREDVIPFLEIVTRGRNVPRERLLAVAEHYYHFVGKSPINDQVRELIAVAPAIRAFVDARC